MGKGREAASDLAAWGTQGTAGSCDSSVGGRAEGSMCVMEEQGERLRTIGDGEPSVLLLDLKVVA